MISRLASRIFSQTRRATMQRGGVLQMPPAYSANYDVGSKYMIGWFAYCFAFTFHLIYNELGFLKQTGVAIEKHYEKRCSEPAGLEYCDGVARQKLMAQRLEWIAIDNADEDDDEDDE